MPLKPNFGNMLGHGQLGLRSNLRTFTDLLDQSGSHRDLLAVVEPVITVTGWSLSGGTIYVAPFEYTYKGIRRDVKSVSAVGDPDLTRAETATLSSGEYYYDPNEVFDQDVFKWDDGVGTWQIPTILYDGSSDYLVSSSAGLTGLADGPKGTFSCWIKVDDYPASAGYILMNISSRCYIYISNLGRIEMRMRDSTPTEILRMRTDVLTKGVFHHVSGSWNLDGTPTADLYLDGVQSYNEVTAPTTGTIEYTTGEWAIAATQTGASPLDGVLGALWFTPDTEITGAALHTSFRNADGTPADLGYYGTKPTGNRPLIWINNPADILGENLGTGGAFAKQGSPTDYGYAPPNLTARLKWDQFPKLYVNLTDDSNPSDTTIVSHLGYHFATRAQIHPTLGADLLSGDGDFEDWTAGVPDNWNDGTGDGVLAEETSDTYKGNSSAKLSLVGTEGDDWKQIYYTVSDPVDGGIYRLCGYYKTDITTGSNVAQIKIKDSSDAKTVWSDGRLIRGDVQIPMDDTAGYWRYFCFDFYWNAAELPNDMQVELFISGTSAVADVYFDNVSVKRVWRYEFYEPRMTDSAIPATTSGSNDIFFGGKRTSTGGVGFINHDKFFEVAGGQLEWINQRSTIFVGGRFLSDPLAAASAPDAFDEGQEILFNDMRQAYSGLIQRLKVSDTLAQLDMQDVRTYFHIKLPRRVYADTDFANLYTTDWQGKVRPIFFGAKTNITPARIDYETGTNKYGKYEICDCTDAPNGIKAVDAVYAYTDKTQAALKSSANRITLTEDTHYTVDLTLGRFTVDVDIGPYVIVAGENDVLDFNDGGAQQAVLTAGLYTAAGLASHIQTQVDAESTDTITCTYSDSTNKFTLASDGGTFQLLLKTGTNKERSAYKLLGFTDSADKTGSTSYAGDDATFTDADTNHVLRCDAQGYKDDASGTYTGSANALIEIGADICRVLLIKFMDRPTSVIDEVSFVDARSRSTETLTMFINKSTSSKDIFERLEFSNIANIVIDGEGVVHYEVYVGTVPASTKTIYERDIQSFEAQKGYQDVYQTIRVLYDQDPSTGEARAREATDTSVRVRLGRQEIKEFPTYLKYSDNATSVCNRMLELSKQAARKLTLGVLGGSLIDHKVGDKVRLERDRALGSSGELAQESFRILSVKKDYIKGLVILEVTDDKITVASQACVSSCQLFCEISCQRECQLECQDFCKLNCEIGCETSCQDLCELECQETCQLGCLQVTCELTCQAGGCESVCQACEGAGCQEDCESACKTGCEVTCQDTCKLNGCQTVCQQEDCRQAACESSCRTDCRLGTSCQTGCQISEEAVDPCEASCQDACQLTCRDDCQLGACQFVDETAV
jgi:hypothetical protein